MEEPLGQAAEQHLVLQFRDRDTGEISDFEFDKVGRRQTYAFQGGYFQVCNEKLIKMLSAESELTPQQFSIFMYYAASALNLSKSARKDKTVSEVADEMGLARETVSRTVTMLTRHRILIMTGRKAQMRYYTASPHIAFAGTAAEHREATSAVVYPTIPEKKTSSRGKPRIVKG